RRRCIFAAGRIALGGPGTSPLEFKLEPTAGIPGLFDRPLVLDLRLARRDNARRQRSRRRRPGRALGGPRGLRLRLFAAAAHHLRPSNDHARTRTLTLCCHGLLGTTPTITCGRLLGRTRHHGRRPTFRSRRALGGTLDRTLVRAIAATLGRALDGTVGGTVG